MLNIPEAVKTLFKTDSVKKNFRVHFPNSEYRDLTNSDIVAGSVKFTESVCSKDVLQFGLAEASRIEFECVGVPNIYGATIECFCEVDTSSLSAEYQTVKADVSYPVYAVPYGSFRVQSCPRNAGAMTHRRVEAYTADKVSNHVLSYQLQRKFQIRLFNETLVQNIPLLIASEIDDQMGLNLSETTVQMTQRSLSTTLSNTWQYNGDEYNLDCIITSFNVSSSINELGAMYRFTCNADMTSHNAMYTDLVDNYGLTGDMFESVRDSVEPAIHYSELTYEMVHFDNPADSKFFYPYISNIDSSWNPMVAYPDSFTAELSQNGTVIKTYTVGQYITNPVLYKYTLTDQNDINAQLSLKATGQQTFSGVNYYTFVDSLNFTDIVNGYSELIARFLKPSRTGGAVEYALTKTTPVSLTVQDYADMWWDEFSVSPVGSIKYTYYDENTKQENIAVYTFGTGQSVYDMTNNAYLKTLVKPAGYSGTVQEYVQSLFDTYFIPNITDIAFTPVDLSAIGLPYLEAGDYIEVIAEDGTVVGTYIMARTLTGEQYLEDSIESSGGEIIGSNVRSA